MDGGSFPHHLVGQDCLKPIMSTVTIVVSYIVALVMDVERIPLEGVDVKE